MVYEVNSAGTETVLHTFAGSPSDGEAPNTAVVRDEAGNIYGTTLVGGSGSSCSGGCGTVFKIDAAGNETVLYSFTGGSDGCYPLQSLLRNKTGDLFGTTNGNVYGAVPGYPSCGNGTIFKVDSAGNFTLLHSFAAGSSDGAGPSGGHLTMDSSGNLYGLTTEAGSKSSGVLYKLSKDGELTCYET